MDSNVGQSIVKLQAIAEKIGFIAIIRENGVSFQDRETLAQINFEFDNQGLIYPYIYIRTRSWDLPGERTDANELFSILTAVFLRINNCASCRVWDIPHPVQVPNTEIYARFLVPDQLASAVYQLGSEGVEEVEKFSATVRYLGLSYSQLLDWDTTKPIGLEADENYNCRDAQPWAEHISNIVGEKFDVEKIQFCRRINPCWMHYRSIQTRLTIYYAPQLSKALVSILSGDIPWEATAISTGTIYDSGDIRNFIATRESRFVERVLKTLNKARHLKGMVHIPLENAFVSSSGDYIAFLYRETSKKRFEYELERARDKHTRDAKVLFPQNDFLWSTSIDGARFESFIIDLLKFEKGVSWIRQVSNSNERDGGKDLLCNWWTMSSSSADFDENTSPYTERKVIVQCKAFKDAVHKSKVPDIRDTVEHHNADGFFLVVASHLGTTLTEHLYKLKTEGNIWVDWWTRREIEDRLKLHRHIVAKYPDIVKFK